MSTAKSGQTNHCDPRTAFLAGPLPMAASALARLVLLGQRLHRLRLAQFIALGNHVLAKVIRLAAVRLLGDDAPTTAC
jgi:hypothetical protein